MANQLLFTLGRELDANGNTVPGAKAYFYESGTTTPITAYQDNATTTAHAWPQVSDGGGLFTTAFISGASAKVVITKTDDTTLRTIDPCPVISVGGVGASGISFNPTVDIPETNVQDAIEAAAETAASGFAAFGLGVTGNAPDLANIDATNIGVGFYRTTASTTGTFPTGITASSTSIVRVERETSALGVMTLLDDSGKVFQRFMVASSWGAWRHIVTMPVSPTTGDIVHWNGSAWAGIAGGATGQVLTGVTGGNPTFQTPAVPNWSLIASGTLSGASVTVTGLGGASRVMVCAYGMTSVGSSTRNVRVGNSGGILSTSIYKDYAGTDTSWKMAQNNTAARAFTLVIERFNTTEAYKPAHGEVFASSDPPVGVVTSTALDRVQILSPSSDFTAGEYFVYRWV